MQKESFFKTKAGGLTIAFFVILFAFVMILLGMDADSNLLCGTGCVLIILAMLYSPVKVYLWHKRR